MALGLAACSADEGTSTTEDLETSIPTHRYSGPGSFYRAVIDGQGGFEIEVSESFSSPVVMTIGGQYQRLPSGFLELQVQTATASVDGAPSVGQTATALELPGFALFLNPAGSDEVIPMLIMDACPTQNFDANWIMIRGEAGRDASHPDREWLGTFEYEHGTVPQSRIPSRFNLSNLSPLLDAPAAIDAMGCQMGHLPVYEAGRLTANMWLTDGGAIVETFVQDGTEQALVAMRQQAATTADVQGSYAALWVGQTVSAGTISFDANGNGTGSLLTNPADLQSATAPFTLSLSAAPTLGTGWLSGTIQSTGAGNIACSALSGAGQTLRTVLVCIGQDPADTSRSISLLLASSPGA